MLKRKKGFALYLDSIDIDRAVKNEIFCEEADEIIEQDIWDKDFPLADQTLKWMLLDKVAWLNNEFVENFQSKYEGVCLSKLDEISLLMKEAVTYHDEVSIYDIFNVAIVAEFGSFKSMIYLLEKAIFYCNGYFYPFKIYSYIQKEACCSVDYCLLADSLALLFEKYNIINPDAIKKLLDKSKEKMNSDYEKLSLAFSYHRNNYDNDAEEIFYPTVQLILDEIKSGDTDYQAIRSLITALDEEYNIVRDEKNFSWKLELSNKLYGAFYNNED